MGENMRKVKIDREKCTNCMECVEICPDEVFQIVDEKPVYVRAEHCQECDLCLFVCPENVISFLEA
ncbi:MAG: 4Fe-4S dicluster domain-containing protein [Candidatus Electrothrix sp. ATG2]|nr:4Fe-4S dicluster domain-containing protein [Candidatus Electrothrix sp. ATG2]